MSLFPFRFVYNRSPESTSDSGSLQSRLFRRFQESAVGSAALSLADRMTPAPVRNLLNEVGSRVTGSVPVPLLSPQASSNPNVTETHVVEIMGLSREQVRDRVYAAFAPGVNLERRHELLVELHILLQGEFRAFASVSPPPGDPDTQVKALLETCDGSADRAHARFMEIFPAAGWSAETLTVNSTLLLEYPEMLASMMGTPSERAVFSDKEIYYQTFAIRQAIDPDFSASIGTPYDARKDVLSPLNDEVDRLRPEDVPVEEWRGIRKDILNYNANRYYREFALLRYLAEIDPADTALREQLERSLRYLPVPVPGGTPSINVAMDLGLSKGSAIITPPYYWGNIDAICDAPGTFATPCEYVDRQGNIDPEQLRLKIRELKEAGLTKVTIYFNFPLNCNGAVPTEAEAIALANVIREEANGNFFITSVCDEPYDLFMWGKDCIKRPFSTFLIPGDNRNMMTIACSRNGTKRDGCPGLRHADMMIMTSDAVSPEGHAAFHNKLDGLFRARYSASPTLAPYMISRHITGDPRIINSPPGQILGPDRERVMESIVRHQKEDENMRREYIRATKDRMTAACKGNAVVSRYLVVAETLTCADGMYMVSLSPSPELESMGVTTHDIHLGGLAAGRPGVISTQGYVRLNTSEVSGDVLEEFVVSLARATESAIRAKGRGHLLDNGATTTRPGLLSRLTSLIGSSRGNPDEADPPVVDPRDLPTPPRPPNATAWETARTHPEKIDLTALFWQRFERGLCRIFEAIPEERQKRVEVIADCLQILTHEQMRVLHKNRGVDKTSHPTQTYPVVIYRRLYKILAEVQTAYDAVVEANPTGWTKDICRLNARTAVDELSRLAGDMVGTVSASRIPSMGGLTEEGVRPLQTIYEGLSNSQTDDELERVLDRQILPRTISLVSDEFSETTELVEDAKRWLLHGIGEIDTYWADFDGVGIDRAGRATGRILSDELGTLKTDIDRGIALGLLDTHPYTRGVYRGDDDSQVSHDSLLFRAAQMDVAIFELTQYLRQDGLTASNRQACEREMNMKKKRRKQFLVELTQIRNLIEREQRERRVHKLIFLSKKTQFHPRIDPACTAVVRRFMAGEFSLENGDLQLLQVARNIALQVFDLNDLSRENMCFDGRALPEPFESFPKVPQIMLSQCGSDDESPANEEVQAMREFLICMEFVEAHGPDRPWMPQAIEWIKRRKRQSPAQRRQHPSNIEEDTYVVPLFETPETTSPEAITTYLERTLEDDFGGDAQLMEQRAPEVFIAGSDLSRLMGQVPAFIQYMMFVAAVEEFNRKHKIDIRVKLGSGEDIFRMGGLFNVDSLLSVLAGRVRSDCPDFESLSDGERAQITSDRAFLELKYGPDYEKIMREPAEGFLTIARVCPQTNVATYQARAREMSRIEIDAGRERELMRMWAEMRAHAFEKTPRGARVRHAPRLERFLTGDLKWLNEIRIVGFEEMKKLVGDPTRNQSGKRPPRPNDPAAPPDGSAHGVGGHASVLGKKVIKNRPRPSGRPGKIGSMATEVLKLARKSEIDARAISSSAALKLIYPAELLEKRAVLEKAHSQEGGLAQFLPFLQIKPLLKSMLMFDAVRPETVRILRSRGANDLADLLEREWAGLARFISPLQQEYRRRLSREAIGRAARLPDRRSGLGRLVSSPPKTDMALESWTPEDQARYAFLSKPMNRELLDPVWGRSLSRGTIGWAQMYTERAPEILGKVCDFTACSQTFLQDMERVTRQIMSDTGRTDRRAIKDEIAAELQSTHSVDPVAPSGSRSLFAAARRGVTQALSALSRPDPVTAAVGQDAGLRQSYEALAPFAFTDDETTDLDRLMGSRGFVNHTFG